MCNNFSLAMAMQFQEIIAFPLHLQISLWSVSCAGNATSSEKLQEKNMKTLNILESFPPANFASPPSSRRQKNARVAVALSWGYTKRFSLPTPMQVLELFHNHRTERKLQYVLPARNITRFFIFSFNFQFSILNFSEVVASRLSAQDMLHTEILMCDGNRIS